MSKRSIFAAIAAAVIAAPLTTIAAQPAAKAKAAGLSPTCAAKAPVRDYFITVNELSTVPKDRDKKPAAYTDRGIARAANSKLDRYSFDPGVIIVKRGDCVNLRIHDLKGDHHNVTIEGTEVSTEGAAIIDDAGKVVGKLVARANPNAYEDPAKLKAGEFARGEQVLLKFQANQPGTYRMICEVHTFIGPKGELRGYDDKGKTVQGPMVAYLTVLP